MKILKLHSDCVLTSGYQRSLIVDLGRKKTHLIPNALYDILKTFEGHYLSEVYKKYEGYKEVLDEYFDFLFREEIIFLADESQKQNFKALDLGFDFPGDISNCIIELSDKNLKNLRTIVASLVGLGCMDFEFRRYVSLEQSDLKKIESSLHSFPLNSIQLVVRKKSDNLENLIKLINESHLPFRSVVFHSGDEDKFHSLPKILPTILEVREQYKNEKNCGQISKHYFVTGLDFFTESQSHNTCLNKKVTIDSDGNIKNCPGMSFSYGNINYISLEEVINQSDFRKFWNIKKDDILVCKDCEFRHICMDCRAYIENPYDLHSKPLKCGYDPYTNQWQEWSANPLKQKAIDFYGLREILPSEKNETS